jgi:hypothetical protein
MTEISYSVVYDDDGEPYILRSDGVGLSANVFDDMMELNKQNPDFFEHWIALMETYLFLVPPPGDA